MGEEKGILASLYNKIYKLLIVRIIALEVE